MTKTLNILLPVYNEEKRLENGVTRTAEYLSAHTGIDFVLTIVDNASIDRTQEIAQALCRRWAGRVDYIRIDQKGVGAAFRAGVAANTRDIVGYMDIDLSTDIQHIPEMMQVFENDPAAAMVNASRWNRRSDTTGRKMYRNVTSLGLVWLLKAVFGMKASDAICGFKFFRKDVLKPLMAETREENGWFYLIELLLRAERARIKIVELPVRWEDDTKNSTVKTFALIREYLRQIIALRRRMRR